MLAQGMGSGVQYISRSNPLPNKERNAFGGEAQPCPGLVAVADKGHTDNFCHLCPLALSPEERPEPLWCSGQGKLEKRLLVTVQLF